MASILQGDSPCLCGPLSSHISWRIPRSPLSRIKPTYYPGILPRGDTGWPQGTLRCCGFHIQNHLDSLHSYLGDHKMIQEWKRHPTPWEVAIKSSSWFLSTKNQGACPPPKSELTLVSFNQFKWKTRSEWQLMKTSAGSIKKKKR